MLFKNFYDMNAEVLMLSFVTFCYILWCFVVFKKKSLIYMKNLYLLLFLQQILCNYD